MTEPQSKKITEDASDNILKKTWELFGSVKTGDEGQKLGGDGL